MVSAAAWDAPRPQCPLRVRALIAIVIIFLPGLTSILYAQTTPVPVQARIRPAASVGAAPEASAVTLLVGRSTVLDVPSPVSRVSLTSPDVADVMVTTPQQVLIHGKAVGTISMFVWERAGGIRRYEVVVHRDMSQLEGQLQELFPGEPIAVASNGKNVVLSGTVSSKYAVDKAAEVAVGYVEKKENVVNLLQQVQAVSNQVLLRVRFAEVARTALSELGASFFTDATGYKDWIGRTTTQQFAAPIFDEGKLVFSDYLNFFLFNTEYSAGTLIKALSTRGLFQSLAEPNLIAQNGTEASFLAGGEYPYPVVQGQAGGTAVTIQFKEFGIRLNFTPTVLGGGLIHLKVRPEVSALDFTNAISLQGFRIPALSTRRAETQVELRDGQTFAIAGLLNNNLTSTMEKIPGIGDIPILGLLFKSRAARKEQTELVVMITPQILPPGSPGAAPALPGLVDPYLPPVPRPIPPPAPYGGPRGSAAPVPQNAPRVAAPAASSSQPAATPGPATSVAPTPAAPVSAVAPPPPPKPTKQEQQAMERARQEEQKRQQAEAAVRAAEQKRAAEQAKLDAQRAAEEQTRKAAQAKIDAQRAAEAAKKQQELDREQARQKAEADRRAAEARKRQEEAERKRGAALAEAEARLKAAQAAYQEQLKSSSTQNRQ
jgi:pilus assembly protein CpaC